MVGSPHPTPESAAGPPGSPQRHSETSSFQPVNLATHSRLRYPVAPGKARAAPSLPAMPATLAPPAVLALPAVQALRPVPALPAVRWLLAVRAAQSLPPSRPPAADRSSHACASNPSALPIRSQIVYTSRVSLATRSRNARTPVRPASPNRPAAAPAAPAPPTAVRFLPRLVETLAKPSVIPASSAGIQGPPNREAAGILVERPAPTRVGQRSPVGEGFPIAMPRFRPVASGRPEHAPNPAEKRPASPQEFFRKNSYCARGAPFRPSRRPSNRPASSCRDHVRLLFG